MNFAQMYPDQARLFKLGFEILEYYKNNPTQLVLEIHPYDLKELWNTEITYETKDHAGRMGFIDLEGPSLLIADAKNNNVLKIELWINTNRPHWIPKIRIK